MKRAFGWLAGLVGIAALGRWLARRHGRPSARDGRDAWPEPPAASSSGTDPAVELRRRLDESRIEEPPAAELPEERTLQERRADVHARAQETTDAMRESGL